MSRTERTALPWGSCGHRDVLWPPQGSGTCSRKMPWPRPELPFRGSPIHEGFPSLQEGNWAGCARAHRAQELLGAGSEGFWSPAHTWGLWLSPALLLPAPAPAGVPTLPEEQSPGEGSSLCRMHHVLMPGRVQDKHAAVSAVPHLHVNTNRHRVY